jgi:F-type H+-transporting ATPase subunit c
LTSQALVAAFTLLAFGLIVAGVALGSAIGDGIVASKAVEAIARQPEARPNIFVFLFLGVGVLEAFPIIGLGLAFYLLLVVVGLPSSGLYASLAGH